MSNKRGKKKRGAPVRRAPARMAPPPSPPVGVERKALESATIVERYAELKRPFPESLISLLEMMEATDELRYDPEIGEDGLAWKTPQEFESWAQEEPARAGRAVRQMMLRVLRGPAEQRIKLRRFQDEQHRLQALIGEYDDYALTLEDFREAFPGPEDPDDHVKAMLEGNYLERYRNGYRWNAKGKKLIGSMRKAEEETPITDRKFERLAIEPVEGDVPAAELVETYGVEFLDELARTGHVEVTSGDIHGVPTTYRWTEKAWNRRLRDQQREWAEREDSFTFRTDPTAFLEIADKYKDQVDDWFAIDTNPDADNLLTITVVGPFADMLRDHYREHGEDPRPDMRAVFEAAKAFGGGLPEGFDPAASYSYDSEGGAMELVTTAARKALGAEYPPLEKGERDGVTVGLRDGTSITIPVVGGQDRESIWMPTPTLRRFSALAREEELPYALTEGDLEELHPSGRHVVAGAKIARLEDGHHYVRVSMSMAVYEIDVKGRRLAEGSLESLRDARPFSRADSDHITEALGKVAGIDAAKLKAQEVFFEPAGDGMLRWVPEAQARLIKDIEENYREIAEEPWRKDVDLPIKQFGLLMEGQLADVEEHASLASLFEGKAFPYRGLPSALEKPRWMASHSFGRLWDRCDELARIALLWERNRKDARARSRIGDAWPGFEAVALSPRALVCMDALERLRRAQVLAVDMDVFEGAPEWESAEEAWAYGREVKLPFDPLYLDLTAPGGLSPLIQVTDAPDDQPLALRGALMWHDATGNLVVAPVAWMHDYPEAPWQSFDIIGRAVFGGYTPSGDVEDVRIRPSTKGLDLSSIMTVVRPGSIFSEEPDPPLEGRIDALVSMMASDLMREALPEKAAATARFTRTWAGMVALCAARALSILSMLEAMNVELGEGQPNREEQRQVKRAQKRGWPVKIAKTVLVRPTKYREARGESKRVREYSHAFWRRGHYSFYPLGTRIADKLAEEDPKSRHLVNHPVKGLCRKVYVSPTIVGAVGADGERRTPIEKTRVWKTERTREPVLSRASG